MVGSSSTRTYPMPVPNGFAGSGALVRWAPNPNHCHEQVEHWLAVNPDDHPVRGWLVAANLITAIRFASHSLARTAAGQLLDVAFERPEHKPLFIEHPIAAGDFVPLVLGVPTLPFVDVPISNWS